MKDHLRIFIIISLSIILFSITGCGQEIAPTGKTIDEWHITLYNSSTSDIDGPEPPNPNPVISPHYDPSYWIWVLIFILAIMPLVIKKHKKKPSYNL